MEKPNRWIHLALKLIHNQEYIHEAITILALKIHNLLNSMDYHKTKTMKVTFLYWNIQIMVLYLIILTLLQKWNGKKNRILNSIIFDLEAIHSKGFVHRDLHNWNILQVNLNNAYISDLGLTISTKKNKIFMVSCHTLHQKFYRETIYTSVRYLYF